MTSYNQIKNNKFKVVIGALLVLIAASVIFAWEFYGKEILTYRSVPVLVADIERGEEIKTNDLKMVKVSESSLNKDTVYDAGEVVGKEALIDIPANLPLMSNYFLNISNDIEKGKFILAVPADWVYSVPQTVRRDDEVSFYSIPARKADAAVIDGVAPPAIISNTPVLTARVAYAKDSSNHEVVDIKGERIDGSSNISNIEILIDNDQYAKLLQEVSLGNVFVVTYK